MSPYAGKRTYMIPNKGLVIELNEFNLPLLEMAAAQFDLKYIKRILSFHRGVTVADQKVEHQGLDPWVQWVSIHAETPSNIHGVIRLGDSQKLKSEQVWERLSRNGTTTGVWGVMNGSRGKALKNLFFFADPWTFNEAPYPANLARFLSLPTYYAKHYLAISIRELLKSASQSLRFVVGNIKTHTLVADAWFLLRHALGVRPNSCFLFAAFELISTRLFAVYKSRFFPDISFVFLNSIAHFQHHGWDNSSSLDREAAFVFRTIDRILSILLPAEESTELIIVINGLSQKNVKEESLYCYRQIDPEGFLKRIGIRYRRIEQCMTSDGHIFFENSADRNAAVKLLSQATINDAPAFYVEADTTDPKKLFYQVAYWGAADETTKLRFNDFEIRYFDQFAIHAKRTGAHVDEGNYLVNAQILPNRVANSEFFSFIWPAQGLQQHHSF
jgi:hypothetical protein